MFRVCVFCQGYYVWIRNCVGGVRLRVGISIRVGVTCMNIYIDFVSVNPTRVGIPTRSRTANKIVPAKKLFSYLSPIKKCFRLYFPWHSIGFRRQFWPILTLESPGVPLQTCFGQFWDEFSGIRFCMKKTRSTIWTRVVQFSRRDLCSRIVSWEKTLFSLMPQIWLATFFTDNSFP